MALKKKRGLSKQPAFLAAYAKTASITLAAKACKLDRRLHYVWLAADADYAPQFLAARLEAGGVLVDEAVRRAVTGTIKPIFWKGKRVKAVVREYDGETLRFLIKGFLPEYRESFKHEVTGLAGGPIVMANAELTKLSDDELSSLIALTRKLAGAARDGSGAETPPGE